MPMLATLTRLCEGFSGREGGLELLPEPVDRGAGGCRPDVVLDVERDRPGGDQRQATLARLDHLDLERDRATGEAAADARPAPDGLGLRQKIENLAGRTGHAGSCRPPAHVAHKTSGGAPSHRSAG